MCIYAHPYIIIFICVFNNIVVFGCHAIERDLVRCDGCYTCCCFMAIKKDRV